MTDAEKMAREYANKRKEMKNLDNSTWARLEQAFLAGYAAGEKAGAEKFKLAVEALEKVNFDWCNDLDEAASMCRETLTKIRGARG